MIKLSIRGYTSGVCSFGLQQLFDTKIIINERLPILLLQCGLIILTIVTTNSEIILGLNIFSHMIAMLNSIKKIMTMN